MIKSTKQQKYFLKTHLINLFGEANVKQEISFEWMELPNDFMTADHYLNIIAKLTQYRDKTEFIKRYKPRCDFVIESMKLIIEYDEKQHFTVARKVALESYPKDIILYFDKQKWITLCDEIRAKDNDPHYRDEQRAFYDSIRDIQSSLNGYKLIRLKEYDIDWEKTDSEKILKEVIENAKQYEIQG